MQYTSDAGQLGQGLTPEQVAQRLLRDGPNELPGDGPRSFGRIAREVASEPMFALLLIAVSIYIVLGDLREAVVLGASILVIILITIVQERRAEHALSRLRDLSSPRALVIREGIERRIAGRDIVAGDLVILREGDRVPADGTLLSATGLSVDESVLTGESLPVDKLSQLNGTTEAAVCVYSGSLVMSGFGVALIKATGPRTEIGRIGQALAALNAEPTALFAEVRRATRRIAVGALAVCVAIALGYGITRGDWFGGVLAGIATAMGVLPEEFAVVLTVFLAMGAWRISRAGVLTRRMPAIEAIGAATVLAVDKTGTLTENRMQLALMETRHARIDLRGDGTTLDAASRAVLETALAASERRPFDAMERAIHAAAERFIADYASGLPRQELVREYDLTPQLLAVTHVWRGKSGAPLEVAVKGAPETVMELCRLPTDERDLLLQRVQSYAQDGLRVLAVARGTFTGSVLPDSVLDYDLQWLGFVCFADPLRTDVPAALRECARAGVRVVMITGDHPGTALAIAKQAGFDLRGGVMTGAEIEAADESALRARVREVNIYARAKPEHKLRLVQAFKAGGEVIAMTGDGVNDAPALKAAHVGVAMGERGTDVAREAASLVLVNDDFNSLVAAVRLGRRIYDNIGHAVSYIVAVHIPLAGLGLLPVLLGWPLLLFPMHILFLEFVIDPACAFVFEADRESPDLMHRKPRRPEEPLFSAALLRRSLTLGLLVLAYLGILYAGALAMLEDAEARALTFFGMVVTNLALIFVSRSRSGSFREIYSRPNAVFWWIGLLAGLASMAVIYVPAMASAFQFAPPPARALGGVATASVLLVALIGVLLRRDAGHSN